MRNIQRAVYIGGPSHGEIVGGDFNVDLRMGELISGPKPVWWEPGMEWSDYRYRMTGNVVAGMAVYEYEPEKPRQLVPAINEQVFVPARVIQNPGEEGYWVVVGDTEEYGFSEKWSINMIEDVFPSLRQHGYEVEEQISDVNWVVYRP